MSELFVFVVFGFFFFVEGNVILLSLEKNFFRSTMHYIEMIISKLLGPIIFGMSF